MESSEVGLPDVNIESALEGPNEGTVDQHRLSILESVRASLDGIVECIAATALEAPQSQSPKYTGTMAAHILQQMYWRRAERDQVRLQQFEQLQIKAAIKMQSIVRLFITCARLRQQWTAEALSIMKAEERKRKAKLKAEQDNLINRLVIYEKEKKERLKQRVAEKDRLEVAIIAKIITSKHKSRTEVDKTLQQQVVAKLTRLEPSQKKAETLRRHEKEYNMKHGQLFPGNIKVSAPSPNLMKPTIALDWTGSKKAAGALEEDNDEGASATGSRYMCINVSKSNPLRDHNSTEGDAETGQPTDSISSFRTSPTACGGSKSIINSNSSSGGTYMKTTVSNLFREAENFEANASKFTAPKQHVKQLKFAEFHADRARKDDSCLHTRTMKKELLDLHKSAMESIASVKSASVFEGNVAQQSIHDDTGNATFADDSGGRGDKSDRLGGGSSSMYSINSLSKNGPLAVKAQGLGGYNFVVDPSSLLNTPLLSKSFNSSYSKPTESQKASSPDPKNMSNKKRIEQLLLQPLPKMDTKLNEKEIQDMYRVRMLLQQNHDIASGYFSGPYEDDWRRKEGYQAERHAKEPVRRTHELEMQRKGKEEEERLETLRIRLRAQQQSRATRSADSAPASPQRPPVARPSLHVSPRKVANPNLSLAV